MMNPIVKVKTGPNKGYYKWVSKDAIYYATNKAILKRRGAE